METNKIITGDCLAIMSSMPDKSIGLVVTSPPYNLHNTSGGGFPRNKGMWRACQFHDDYDNYDDNMPLDDYNEWQRKCLREMWRILKDDGAIFYNHKWRVQNGLWQDRAEIVKEFPVRQIIIWHKHLGVNFNDGYFVPSYEVIYLIAKPDFVLRKKANALGDVWVITPDKKNKHPAPFPVDLPLRCINSTNDNGIVFDPFMGSGTPAIAATDAGRQWLGAEKSDKYAQGARQRISEHSRRLV